MKAIQEIGATKVIKLKDDKTIRRSQLAAFFYFSNKFLVVDYEIKNSCYLIEAAVKNN